MPLTELTGAVRVTKSGVEAAHWLVRGYVKRRAVRQDARSGREILGIENTDLTYRIGALHPDIAPGSVHPDDEAALLSVAGSTFEAARRAGRFKIVSGPPISLSDSLVLIGSPESEAITRLVFGYEERADGQGMARWCEPPLFTPYSFQEDATIITARSSRYVPGRGLQTRPNWPIVQSAVGAHELFFPRVDRHGLQASDYLVITRIRNFLTRDGYQCGRSIISIAGAHGCGTRAVGLLLEDKKALALIARSLRSRPDAFQILIHIDDIYHDSAFGSRARNIEVADVRPLTVTHTQWEHATAVVEAHLPSWKTEASRARMSAGV